MTDRYNACPEDDLIAEIQRLQRMVDEERTKLAALVERWRGTTWWSNTLPEYVSNRCACELEEAIGGKK